MHNGAEVAEFFFVDTTPFQDKYFNDPGKHTYDWRGVLPRQHYLSELLRVINLTLNIHKLNKIIYIV